MAAHASSSGHDEYDFDLFVSVAGTHARCTRITALILAGHGTGPWRRHRRSACCQDVSAVRCACSQCCASCMNARADLVSHRWQGGPVRAQAGVGCHRRGGRPWWHLHPAWLRAKEGVFSGPSCAGHAGRADAVSDRSCCTTRPASQRRSRMLAATGEHGSCICCCSTYMLHTSLCWLYACSIV